jgi:hypothetical protein
MNRCCMKDDAGVRCEREAVYEAQLPFSNGTIPLSGVYVCNECRERCADVMSCLTARPAVYKQLMLEAMKPIDCA